MTSQADAPGAVDAGSYDYIVVGAGSAGCALAARLTESGMHTVLLLEGGGPDRNVWIHIPLGVGKLLGNDRYAWKFETEPQHGLAGQPIYWPRGKVLGGSSALNGMAYVWGDPAEFDRWKAQGLASWGFADVHPYFRRLENFPYNNDPDRGHDGPVRITDRARRDRDALSNAFVEACQEAGIAPTKDYNAGSYEGVRYLEQTAHNGRRFSTAVAYLRGARRRGNLRIETHALATRIRFDATRAVGLEYRQAGRTLRANARHEVLVCAGAIQSPQLLELSGVGDPAILQPMGIPVIAANRAVGENLIDHIQFRRTYQTNLPITINDIMGNPWRRMLVGAQYLATRRGLMAGTSSTAHAITRTGDDLDAPDVMIRIYHISGKDRYSRSKTGGIDPFSGFSIGGFKLHPAARGSIHVRSADPAEPPRIEPNYLSRAEDVESALRLLELIRRVADQPALRKVIVAEHRPGPDVQTREALLDYAKESGQTAWHTVGTCRMGPANDSVVDEQLRVHGIRGLRVIDASVMPTIPSSNTNAPAIMIGERGADLVLAARSSDAAMQD